MTNRLLEIFLIDQSS